MTPRGRPANRRGTAIVEKAPEAHSPHVMGDQGKGVKAMNDEVQHRIFEPSARPKGRGAARGSRLSTVAGIVSSSGGGLRLTAPWAAEPPSKVYLPAPSSLGASAVSSPSISRAAGARENGCWSSEDSEPCESRERALAARGTGSCEGGAPPWKRASCSRRAQKRFD